jgi:hypothetical protein
MPTPKAQIDAIVTGAGLTIPCNTFTGGAVTRDVTKNRDPGALFPRSVPGTPRHRERHGRLHLRRGHARPDDADPAQGRDRPDRVQRRPDPPRRQQQPDRPHHLHGILVRVPPAEGDTNAGAPTCSTPVELEFACDGVSG